MTPDTTPTGRSVDAGGQEEASQDGPNAGHGYSRYTNGCRCDICRTAKANYSRQRRAAARTLANSNGNGLSDTGFHVVEGITHGRFGYEERGCRCDVCRGAVAKLSVARMRRRRARARTTA